MSVRSVWPAMAITCSLACICVADAAERPSQNGNPATEEPTIDAIADKLKKWEDPQNPPAKPEANRSTLTPWPQLRYDFGLNDDVKSPLDKRDRLHQPITGQLNSQSQLGTPATSAKPPAMSWVGDLHKRITSCWTPPATEHSVGTLKVRIALRLKPDGTLQDRPRLVETQRGTPSQAFAESAIKAIEKCQPYSVLPQVDYEGGWKDIEFDLSTLGLFLLKPAVGTAAYAKSVRMAPTIAGPSRSTQTTVEPAPTDRQLTSTNRPGDAQSLAQTVAYIVTGGFVALDDMNVVDDDTVETPQYVRGLFTLMSANRIYVADPNSCKLTIETNPQISQGIREFTLHLNNVIVSETIYRQASPTSEITLRGDDNVVCFTGARTACLREYAVDVRTDNFRRVANAINYLYGAFCKSASHRGAF